ncbi:MAG: hypothetical protein J7K65_07560 [Planctomycetes bacterium]|nr:hypothetical protein [Planctomycetota bacterium]
MLIVIVLLIAVTQNCTAKSGCPTVFNVKSYGAVGDGEKLDTPAINSAIEACNQSGGGMVHFPPGTYLSGSVRLKYFLSLFMLILFVRKKISETHRIQV